MHVAVVEAWKLTIQNTSGGEQGRGQLRILVFGLGTLGQGYVGRLMR